MTAGVDVTRVTVRSERRALEALCRPDESLDGRHWDKREPDGPVYTGMLDENCDPFVPASTLKVKIREAETWEPPEGCICVYLAEGGRDPHPMNGAAGERCRVRGHRDT